MSVDVGHHHRHDRNGEVAASSGETRKSISDDLQKRMVCMLGALGLCSLYWLLVCLMPLGSHTGNQLSLFRNLALKYLHNVTHLLLNPIAKTVEPFNCGFNERGLQSMCATHSSQQLQLKVVPLGLASIWLFVCDS